MRSICKYGFVAAALVFAVSSASAQTARTYNDQGYDRSLQFNINYDVNIPTGGLKNFVTNPAYKGFTASLAYPVTSQLSLGLGLGYNDYYQKYPRQTYNESGSSISAVVSNSIQQIPLEFLVNYTLTKKGFIRPYIGVGAGVNFISFDQYLGEFDNPTSATRLAVSGEAGFYIPLSGYSSTALKIGASYNYAPYSDFGVSNLDNWGISAGIRIPLR